MERMKKIKEKKVRVNITLDESIYIKYGLYIDNLSSFLNQTLKNYLEKKEKELYSSVESDNNRLCSNYLKEKDHTLDFDEIVQIAKTRWIK